MNKVRAASFEKNSHSQPFKITKKHPNFLPTIGISLKVFKKLRDSCVKLANVIIIKSWMFPGQRMLEKSKKHIGNWLRYGIRTSIMEIFQRIMSKKRWERLTRHMRFWARKVRSF